VRHLASDGRRREPVKVYCRVVRPPSLAQVAKPATSSVATSRPAVRIHIADAGEAQFTACATFAQDGTDHRSHKGKAA
jgi:hypothetical protein